VTVMVWALSPTSSVKCTTASCPTARSIPVRTADLKPIFSTRAMKRKDKDIRGALAAAKEVLDRAKPEDGEEGTETRSTVNVRYFDDPPEN